MRLAGILIATAATLTLGLGIAGAQDAGRGGGRGRGGGSIGYFNPCPPPPTTHHYMFEFYALDSELDPAPANRVDLLKAMVGHIRAKGVYIGLFHQ